MNVKKLNLRKKQVAERYGVHVRSIERMSKDGRLPPPDFYLGKLPIWTGETLDKNDREAAIAKRATDTPVRAA
jgi:hypothetical protein